MRPLLLVALSLLVVVPRATGAPAQWRIETVATQQSSGEPTLTQDPSGTWTYYAAPESSTAVWRKGPSGRWEGPSQTPGAGGDSDVAVDADGVTYVSDLADNNGIDPVSVSFDHTKTFRYKTVLSAGNSNGGNDRQWIVAWGHGHVVNTSRIIDTTGNSGVQLAWVSTNRARSFYGPIVATGTDNVFITGKLVRSVDGTIYLPYVAWDGFPRSHVPTSPTASVAISHDGGLTWTQRHVAAVTAGVIPSFPSVATDAAGRVYLVWMQSKGIFPNVAWWLNNQLVAYDLGGVAMLATSVDGGAQWSAPRAVSDPAQTAAFPWVVAGAPGRVAVGWYGARALVDTGPDAALPITQWDVDVAESLDAGHRWSHDVVATDVHNGSVCMQGIACASPEAVGLVNAPLPFDRRLLDFFSGWITPQGHLIIAYVHDRPALDGNPNDLLTTQNDFLEAVQLRGPRLR